MVDFESEATIGTNRSDILSIIILQRRYEFLNNYEKYLNSALNNKSDEQQMLNKLKAGLDVLYYELLKTLERNIEQKKVDWDIESLKRDLNEAKDINSVMKIYNIINTVLDDVGITTIDYKRKQDYKRILLTNRSRSQ